MFTPKNIQGALEELYDLCDPDYMVDMLVNYSEEFDDSPEQSVSQLSPVGFADWYSLRRRTSAGCLSKRQKRKEVPTQC